MLSNDIKTVCDVMANYHVFIHKGAFALSTIIVNVEIQGLAEKI